MIRKNFITIIVTVFCLFGNRLHASAPDEGMWLMSLVKELNMKEMQKLGMQMSASDIYSQTQPSLKDAVVDFGGFCTGEFVSPNGLVFTNHHCGYDAIASLSTVQHNYLDDGFWASNYQEELPVEGLYVRVLVKMVDLTDSIIPKVANLEQVDRTAKVKEITSRIKAREAEATGLTVEISSMFYGNQYFAFYYETYNDVRLVGTAPQSIGKFGGDTDNWMWPRHTGDFSIFRVYANKSNEPAEYSAENIPYKPKRFLKISLAGFQEGDFAMTIGFPGQTKRYLTSYAMKEVIEQRNPAQINVFSAITNAMKEEMDKDDSVRLLLSSQYASLMNALKLWEGQIEGMTQVMDAIEVKKQEEQKFQKWINSLKTKNTFSNVLSDLEKDYELMGSVNVEFLTKIYAVSLLSTGNLAITASSLEAEYLAEEKDTAAIHAAIADMEVTADEMWPTYNYEAEMKSLYNLLVLLNNQFGENKPQSIKDILANTKGANAEEKLKTWTIQAFEKSFLTSQARMETFSAKPSSKKLKKDALYQLYMNIYNEAMALQPTYSKAQQDISKHTREYIAALMFMQPDKSFYPDANSTMRLSYGTIQDYIPQDAVQYNWYTTDKGIEQKFIDGDEEFDVPDDFLQLLKENKFGKYGDKNGNLPVCFLSNNDITGGNSGSPVLDKNGNLIGLAFDGNYEGTPGDYIIDPAMNRTISVDIRYVLFVVDKYANAKHIVQDLVFVK